MNPSKHLERELSGKTQIQKWIDAQPTLKSTSGQDKDASTLLIDRYELIEQINTLKGALIDGAIALEFMKLEAGRKNDLSTFFKASNAINNIKQALTGATPDEPPKNTDAHVGGGMGYA